jgi:hypothetical protein
MQTKRIVFNFKPTGWLGWVMVVLVAIPLIALSFFFVAAALVLAAVVFVMALARVAWMRPKGAGAMNRAASRHADVIDVEPVEVKESRRGVALDPSAPPTDPAAR